MSRAVVISLTSPNGAPPPLAIFFATSVNKRVAVDLSEKLPSETKSMNATVCLMVLATRALATSAAAEFGSPLAAAAIAS